MFCNQCEQTVQGIACTRKGVCGKNEEVAALLDLIVYGSRGLAVAALKASNKDVTELGRMCVKALFSAVTNVNFDPQALELVLQDIIKLRTKFMAEAGISSDLPVLNFKPVSGNWVEQAKDYGIISLAKDADCNSLAQTLLFGIKGTAAYADHAEVLGYEDNKVYHGVFEALALGFDGASPDMQTWLGAVLNCGQTNLLAMELLDKANTSTYGQPEPTPVSLKPRPGKAILVTGHDLKDLYELLQQTENLGINIYTHGEMLPTHAYPSLKKFPHLAGHFGTAWQNQRKEFPNFPGPVLFTTNCIQQPEASYHDMIVTTGLVGFPQVKHVKNGDFKEVIALAQAASGFSAEQVAAFPDKQVLVGFGKNALLGAADKIIAGVKSGAIKHFFLVGGCDGAKPGRNYYTEFVEKTPNNTLILTLACGKFRFFDKDLGNIDGIPRLLDVGQCNDAYSAIQIAVALAKAFDCSVNDLPLSLVLSWYEQKAVAILLSLLSLGIKNIRLGPSLPAFITPNVLDVLVKNYQIKPISTPDQDLKDILK